MKYIVRVDDRYQHYWAVRVPSLGTQTYQYFPDRRYGSTEKALKAAKTYRGTLLKEHGKSHYLRGYYSKMLPKHKHIRNKSGIIGVNLCKDNRAEIWYWTATFQRQGKQTNKRYNVATYGEKAAFRLACLARFESSGTLYVYKGATFPGKIPVPWDYIKE